jgi:hypothetical protein
VDCVGGLCRWMLSVDAAGGCCRWMLPVARVACREGGWKPTENADVVSLPRVFGGVQRESALTSARGWLAARCSSVAARRSVFRQATAHLPELPPRACLPTTTAMAIK